MALWFANWSRNERLNAWPLVSRLLLDARAAMPSVGAMKAGGVRVASGVFGSGPLTSVAGGAAKGTPPPPGRSGDRAVRRAVG